MPNRIEIPDELQHLIEKRAGSDRRKAKSTGAKAASSAERRRKARRTADGKKAESRKRKAE